MQTIQIHDDLYQNLNKYSLDPNVLLSQVIDNIKNSTFDEDRNFFNKCLDEIVNHKIDLISHSTVWQNIDNIPTHL